MSSSVLIADSAARKPRQEKMYLQFVQHWEESGGIPHRCSLEKVVELCRKRNERIQ